VTAVSAPASSLACTGCGAVVPAERPFTLRCPAARSGDDIDHVLRRSITPAAMERQPDAHANPFVRYRTRFHAYHVARSAGWSDGRFVDLILELDAAIAQVDGHGFETTPLVRSAGLDAALGFGPGGGVWVKDETGNVSGSHKARHLMGVMLALRVAEVLGQADPRAPLAIASCGNAALAAAVVAIVYLVSEGAERFLSSELGNLAGLLAAALVVFFLAPLQRFSEHVASAAMPGTQNTPEYAAFRKLQVYEAAVAEARSGDGISQKERLLLNRLRDSLGISVADAETVERELPATRDNTAIQSANNR